MRQQRNRWNLRKGDRRCQRVRRWRRRGRRRDRHSSHTGTGSHLEASTPDAGLSINDGGRIQQHVSSDRPDRSRDVPYHRHTPADGRGVAVNGSQNQKRAAGDHGILGQGRAGGEYLITDVKEEFRRLG